MFIRPKDSRQRIYKYIAQLNNHRTFGTFISVVEICFKMRFGNYAVAAVVVVARANAFQTSALTPRFGVQVRQCRACRDDVVVFVWRYVVK